MKRHEELTAEIGKLNAVRIGLIDRMADEKAAGLIDQIADTYIRLTGTQLQLEQELETYDDRTRHHPERRVHP